MEIVRAAQWESRIKRVFVTLKKDGRYMTQAQIDALVEHWLESELDEADDFRAIEGPFSDEDRDTKSLILSDQWEESNEALVSCNYRKVEREADALLKAAGLPTLDHAGAEFEKLCRRLLQAKIEYARIETDKWEGRDSYQRPARGAWCERQGYIPDESNPVKGLAPAKKQARKLAAPPRPFTDEELMKVFGSSDFKKQREKHPERYWLSLICCFRYADATSSTVKSSSTKCCHRTNERPRIYARGERHGFVTPAC